MYHYTLKSDPFSSHQKMARLVEKLSPKGRVLDVGCGKGFLPRSLGNSFQGTIEGIDKNRTIFQVATSYYDKTYLFDVEMIKKLPVKGVYDLIVFGDILEHVNNPRWVLRRFTPLLERDGKIIISIPNVAHWSTRIWLLFGSFHYRDRGILDQTHVRFFTFDGAVSMIKSSGLSIENIDWTPIPLPLLVPLTNDHHPLFFLHWLNAKLTSAWPTLLAYQFIFSCSRNNPRKNVLDTSLAIDAENVEKDRN